MAALLTMLGWLFGLGSLVCFILVIVKMFQHGDTTLAIVCLVLIPCIGIGPLIAFVMGWVRAGAWGIQSIMLAWTGCFIAAVICNVGAAMMGGGFQPPAV